MSSCPRCKKQVYHAERQLGTDGLTYHAICWGLTVQEKKAGKAASSEGDKRIKSPRDDGKAAPVKVSAPHSTPEPPAEPASLEAARFLVAKYGFKTSVPGELSFEKRDKFVLLSTREGKGKDWWLARTEDGRVGLVPSNYVVVVDATTVKQKAEQKAAAAERDSVVSNRSSAPLAIPGPAPAWSDDEEETARKSAGYFLKISSIWSC